MGVVSSVARGMWASGCNEHLTRRVYLPKNLNKDYMCVQKYRVVEYYSCLSPLFLLLSRFFSHNDGKSVPPSIPFVYSIIWQHLNTDNNSSAERIMIIFGLTNSRIPPWIDLKQESRKMQWELYRHYLE